MSGTDSSPSTISDLPSHEHPDVARFMLAAQGCTNGNPVFLIEELEAGESDPSRALSRSLETGQVEAAIRAHDLAYQMYCYSEPRLREGSEPPELIWAPYAGSFAVPDAEPTFHSLGTERLRELWHWLVSVRGPYAQEPPHEHDPDELVRAFEAALYGENSQSGLLGQADEWQHWLITPDFLHASGDEDDPDEIPDGVLAYFEAIGTNIAWLGLGPKQFLIFLLNAYPPISDVPDFLPR